MFERAKGGKVGRIAQALTSHLANSGNPIAKARVENALDIKGLYEARGRIVHQAIDAPDEFERKTRLLESIAAELLRYRFKLPFSEDGRLAARLAETGLLRIRENHDVQSHHRAV
jgi:hypothetical protein